MSAQLSFSTVPQHCDNSNHDVVIMLSQRCCGSWDNFLWHFYSYIESKNNLIMFNNDRTLATPMHIRFSFTLITPLITKKIILNLHFGKNLVERKKLLLCNIQKCFIFPFSSLQLERHSIERQVNTQ